MGSGSEAPKKEAGSEGLCLVFLAFFISVPFLAGVGKGPAVLAVLVGLFGSKKEISSVGTPPERKDLSIGSAAPPKAKLTVGSPELIREVEWAPGSGILWYPREVQSQEEKANPLSNKSLGAGSEQKNLKFVPRKRTKGLAVKALSTLLDKGLPKVNPERGKRKSFGFA